jgi:diguanylate cyclase (GGDEF)-like protein/PAS domain S-box-containing protein
VTSLEAEWLRLTDGSPTAAQELSECLTFVLEGAELGIWDWNIETGEVLFNSRWAQMLGYALDEIEPNVRTWENLVHPEDKLLVTDQLTAHLEGRTPFYRTEHRMRHKAGYWVWILDRGKVVSRAEDGRPLRACGTHMDLTERKRLEEEIEGQRQLLAEANKRLAQLAAIDDLSGIGNRRAFQERIDIEFRRFARYGTPLSVSLLDLDDFKDYNDTFGHPAGDELIRQVAQLLQQSLRETDAVFRYGGEEFVIVMPNTEAAQASASIERIRGAIESATWPNRAVTLSAGVATAPGTGRERVESWSVAELVERADASLYASKKAGRNRVTHAASLAPE